MGGNLRGRIAGLAITGLLVVGAIGVTSMSASGQELASGVPYQSFGTLQIESLTDAGATYFLDRPNTANDIRETISANNPCATIGPSRGSLVRVSPNPGTATVSDTVQIRNNAFGVNTGGTSCGSSSAATISRSERLKIELGSTLTGVSVASASLKLTRFKSGNLTVGFDNGDQVAAGLTTPWSAQTVSVDAGVITTASDVFTSITIGSDSNKESEGLSLAVGTTFNLVTPNPNFDVAVNCNEFVLATVIGGATVASSATYERLDNKTGTNPCQEVGVRAQIQPATGTSNAPILERVFWNNDVQGVGGGTTQSVQAYFTIAWRATATLSDLNRVIDYDGDTVGGQTAVPMQWCAGTTGGIPILPTSSLNVGIDVGSKLQPDGTTFSAAIWKAPWCLVEDSRVLAADGKIVQTQKLFGSGDPWAR